MPKKTTRPTTSAGTSASVEASAAGAATADFEHAVDAEFVRTEPALSAAARVNVREPNLNDSLQAPAAHMQTVTVQERYTAQPMATPSQPMSTARSSSMAKPAMFALAAAPFAIRTVAKWRANPKHKKVRNYMTASPVVVHDHETVSEAARKLEFANIGAAPIGSHGNLVGMITDRDIVTQVIARGLSPETTYVRELGLEQPVVVGAGDSIQRAANLMTRHSVRRLPVIENERLVGVIAQADIAVAIGPEKAGTMLEAISSAPSND